MEKFAIGLVIGTLGGALLTANNYKMRTLVKKSQQEVQTKLDKFMDDKLQEMELSESSEESSQDASDPASDDKKKSKKKAAKA